MWIEHTERLVATLFLMGYVVGLYTMLALVWVGRFQKDRETDSFRRGVSEPKTPPFPPKPDPNICPTTAKGNYPEYNHVWVVKDLNYPRGPNDVG